MHNILYCTSMMWLTFDTWVFADQASSHDAQKHCRHDGQHAHWNRPPGKLCAYHVVFYESCFVCLRGPCVHTVELSCYVGWKNQGSKRIKWPIGSWLQSHNFIQIQHYLLVLNYRWKWDHSSSTWLQADRGWLKRWSLQTAHSSAVLE